MNRRFLSAALALLIPFYGMMRLSESGISEENGKQSVGNVDACPLLPSMTRISAADNLWRAATGAGKFQFVDPRIFGLGRRCLALSSSLAHSWADPVVLSPQSLCVKLQV
jgi:hypothetical protein